MSSDGVVRTVSPTSHPEVGRDVTILSDYYLSASADPGQLICTVLLTGPNYERWAKYMRNSLKAKNKLGFIDGLVTRPKSGANEIKLWDIVNSMLVAWILNTIDPKLRASVSCADSAFELWEDLRTRFSVGNEPRVYELKASVANFKQEAYSVQDYFGRLKLLWDDLNDFEPIPDCCCGQVKCVSTQKHVEIRDKERKYQFLMGLDSVRFGSTRSNILCMTPPPSLESAFSMVLQEERHQHVTRVADSRPDPVGFSAQLANASASSGRGRNVLTCTYCGRSGHEERTCYQIHGFPDNGRGRGRSRGNNNSRGQQVTYGRANSAQVMGGESSVQLHITGADRQGLSLNDEQWNTLVNLLNSAKSTPRERLSGPCYEDADWSG